MTEQCKHEWGLDGPDLELECVNYPCKETITIDQLLNEHDKLKAATEKLSAELVLTALHYVEEGGGKMGDALRAYADALAR